MQSTIHQFIDSKVSENSRTQVSEKREAPIRIALPFKDQKSANVVRRKVGDLSRKVNEDISPVFTSRKIKDEIKVREDKPPLVNQQCVVYYFIISVTCVMQVMSVIRAGTFSNELRNTKDRQSETSRQSETISESNMIWNRRTSRKVLEF